MRREGLLKIMGLKMQNQSNQNQNQPWHVVSIKRDYVITKGTMRQGELFIKMSVQPALAWGGKIGICQKTARCPPGIQKTSKALPKGSVYST